MADITADEKRSAQLQATVWENVFNSCQSSAQHRRDIDPNVMNTLATFALIVGGEYRRIANSGQFDE